ncbi:DEAD-box ATP-dependent RNA helicase 38 [Physcomitrium patens]|uniref:DEAD/DEAH-box helicase domain-containing protein n=1 Tax=Physcomitrium patens TaxID=3218 RepID=A0A2K1IGQ4_PHYPA|nr:DEAD-box ATP-dependent RNA helicase 38-like [Physcomitrium patens]PNR28455.1 hypothetical protein PHYPA_029047 [Physcomitrium patens]|eukprot:XP_024363726.1 DEAD-box ATP-dependent RNA helicase 38-like [Physcomitrella patens]
MLKTTIYMMPATVVITNSIRGLTNELQIQTQFIRELGCVHDTDFEGKTTPFDSIDLKIDAPQLLLLFPKQDLVNQCKDKLSRNKKFVPATLCLAGPSPPSERIKAQVVIGTPGCMKRLISAHKAVHTTHIKTVVFAEADHIFAKDEYVDDSLRLMKYVKKKQSSEFEETPEFQALLLASTSNHKVDSFISKAIPERTNRFISDHAQLLAVSAWEYHIVFSDASAQIDSCKEVMKDRFSRDTHGDGRPLKMKLVEDVWSIVHVSHLSYQELWKFQGRVTNS